MRKLTITYGKKVSAAQFELEKFHTLLFDPATGIPCIAGCYDKKPVEHLKVGEEFELLIGGYWITVTLRCERSSHYYCTTEEEGHQGFRIEFPPRDGESIFLFARKRERWSSPTDSAPFARTIDEELVPYLESRLKEYQGKAHSLEFVWSEMHEAIHDWLVAQQLDPETFNAEARMRLIVRTASNLHMTVN